MQTTAGTCSITGQSVSCSLGDLVQTTLLFGPETFQSIIITGDVAPDAAAGPVVNSAVAQSVRTDPNTANNTGVATSTVARQANLTLTKDTNGTTISAGAIATCTITVANQGPGNADQVVVTDVLPPEVAYIDDLNDACAPGPPVTCSLGTLGPGDSRVLIIEGRLDPAHTGLEIVNAASVTSNGHRP